jgi:Flp pilus assembly protein TadD
MMNMPSVLKLIIAVFLLTTLPAQSHALTPDQVFNKVKDSIVVVKTLDAQGKAKGQGSGVLIPSGKIATNCHVVEGGALYQVGRGKNFVSATLYAEDGDKDICLLNAKGISGKPAELGKAASLKVGVPVYAIGAPRGLELSLSNGIVAQLRGGPPPLIQTTAAISPGSSGGGLFDEKGRLVGLTTLYIEGGQSLNFAMPVEWLGEVKPGRTPVAGTRGRSDWIKRAFALEEMKDWDGLLDWSLSWVKNEPESSMAWFGLGLAYDNLHRYGDAIDAYRQALRINPKNTSFRTNLGIAYTKLNRYSEAIDAYRQVLRIDPEDAHAWYNLGCAYYAVNRYNDAIDAHRQALRIDAEHAYAWNNLGNAYNQLDRYNDAIGAYRQALRISPEYDNAWSGLAIAYYLSGNKTAALNALRQLRRFDSEKADTLFNMMAPR